MPGGRPTKPLALVKGHRTKAEKKVRAEAESALLTGTTLRESPEVKKHPVAHKEFTRIRKLLKAIDKDDDLFGHTINSHCLLVAECKDAEDTVAKMKEEIKELWEAYQRGELEYLDMIDRRGRVQDRILSWDKKIMAKRKMLLDISRENIMTIQSALRSIPKKQQEKPTSKMAEFLNRKKAIT